MSRLISTARTPCAAHLVERAAHEFGLGLEDVDDRGDAVRVGAVQREQVRIAGHDGTQVRLGPVAPVVVQPTPAGSVYVEAAQVVGGVEPRPVDHGIDFVLDAVGGAQAAFGEFDDG